MKREGRQGAEEGRIHLHDHPRRTHVAMLAFVVLSLLLLVGIVSSGGNRALGRLIGLFGSDYAYCATLRESIGRDDYYQFDAGIGFARPGSSSEGIHAIAWMQGETSVYTASVSWNAERLGMFEVAISEDVARAYGLRVGDRLRSKHVVDGTWHEYAIAQLLPHSAGLTAPGDHSHGEGVIVMGYDERYVENISHEAVLFTSEEIEELADRCAEVPRILAYREDEIAGAIGQLAPRLLALLLFAGMLACLFARNLALSIWEDYRRRIMLGFGRRELKRAYWLYICRASLPAVLSLALISELAFSAMGCGLAGVVLQSATLLSAVAALGIVAKLEDGRAWRS